MRIPVRPASQDVGSGRAWTLHWIRKIRLSHVVHQHLYRHFHACAASAGCMGPADKPHQEVACYSLIRYGWIVSTSDTSSQRNADMSAAVLVSYALFAYCLY